jgi:hypothetical protein
VTDDTLPVFPAVAAKVADTARNNRLKLAKDASAVDHIARLGLRMEKFLS